MVSAALAVAGILYTVSTITHAFSPIGGSNSDNQFSLAAYQRARAKETSAQLDASRFHFQILFVDNNNFHGRIAEGMLAKIAEYNDALFTLFPYSSYEAPLDSSAPLEAMDICESLELCTTNVLKMVHHSTYHT